MTGAMRVWDYLPESLQRLPSLMPAALIDRISEIRLRRNAPVVLVLRNTACFVNPLGELLETPEPSCLTVSSAELEEVFMAMCGYTLHSVMDTLKNGYLTLPCGARVGVGVSAVYENGVLIAAENVMSLNVRLPHAWIGCSAALLNFLYVNTFPSIIIAGEPNSGKTTLLRDLARALSGGFNRRYRKVAVVDERNELAGKNNTAFSFDLGSNCDVLTGFQKARGMEIAARTLSPEMIVCDEIATEEEVTAVRAAFSSGIRFALSVHAANRTELSRKPVVRQLLETGEFSYVVLLNRHTYQYEMIDAAELTEAL